MSPEALAVAAVREKQKQSGKGIPSRIALRVETMSGKRVSRLMAAKGWASFCPGKMRSLSHAALAGEKWAVPWKLCNI